MAGGLRKKDKEDPPGLPVSLVAHKKKGIESWNSPAATASLESLVYFIWRTLTNNTL